MITNKLNPKQALTKPYLKVKPDREIMAAFKASLVNLLGLVDEDESEEFNKGLLTNFLKKAYSEDRYFINTKDKSDLVIHNGIKSESTVGVIFETKKPTKTSSAEMPKVDNLNTKAFQQLVLYFLRERVTHNNVDVKHLVVTNVYEWFIFDAKIFEELFYNDNVLKKKFIEFQEKRLSGDKTDFFYKEIAKPAIAIVIDQIKFTHFDLRDYVGAGKGLKPLVLSGDGDRDLIDLYKIFSPEHLLKLRSANDSNSLNKPFYNELLYIIGLSETKEGGKKIIGRVKEGDRQDGSLIENAIAQIIELDKISRDDTQQLFDVALDLAITWVNRILFLKLLEAQLIKYHQGDQDEQDFAFLNSVKIKDYGDLNKLFFSVLALEHGDRAANVQEIFANVPYLNSSLFELTAAERDYIAISSLGSNENLAIFGATVLTDGNDKKRSGKLNALSYLFEFLHAYKFNKDEFEDGQEDSEKLINASVLGLIFEKINGYKDGSFYTPSFITMYMCRETIRRSVVQKFNEEMGWSCENIQDLSDDLGRYIKERDRVVRRNEANGIVNSLKICDPAVGSGHFLVSALNEMIAIKQYLGILQDRNGESLSKYEIEVVNDKLKVTLDGELFAYNPKNKESQRVQEALFHEKQTIIEGCLFGVDINPNSVKICQLRLWIELLKNAYYRTPPSPPLQRGGIERGSLQNGGKEKKEGSLIPPLPKGGLGGVDLETLPNIDINIKCGNSLISRFGLDVDVKQVLQKQKFSIEQYRNAVQTYRSAESKAQKREMEGLIAKIKDGFSSSLSAGDPKKVKLRQLQAELYGVENQMLLLEETKAEVKAREKRVNKLNNEIDKLSAEIEDIESGRLYENALEWRFEFPEVLNDDGDFVGFDLIIGNPPYIGGREWGLAKPEFNYYLNTYKGAEYQFDAYILFWELATNLSKDLICYITPNTWLNNQKNLLIRGILLQSKILKIVDYSKIKVFEDATVLPVITLIQKELTTKNQTEILIPSLEDNSSLVTKCLMSQSNWAQDDLKIINIDASQNDVILRNKIEEEAQLLEDLALIKFGIKVYQTGKGKPKQTAEAALNKVFESKLQVNKEYLPYLKGKDISKYTYEWDNDWLHYGEHLAEPRNIGLFEGDRLLVRRIVGKTLIATHISDDLVTGQLLQIVKPHDSNLSKVILGIINSVLIGYYFRKKYNRQDITFPEIRIYELSSLPIKIPKDTSIFVKLVDEILTAKKGDRHADTSELEKAIDHLVYKLYQLTYDEVKIIDPEFELTEQEYTAIKIE